jgi:hypothetical protein
MEPQLSRQAGILCGQSQSMRILIKNHCQRPFGLFYILNVLREKSKRFFGPLFA